MDFSHVNSPITFRSGQRPIIYDYYKNIAKQRYKAKTKKDFKKLRLKEINQREKARKFFKLEYEKSHKCSITDSAKADFNKLIGLSKGLHNVLFGMDKIIRLFVSKEKNSDSLLTTTDREFEDRLSILKKGNKGLLTEKFIKKMTAETENLIRKFEIAANDPLVQNFARLEVHEVKALNFVGAYLDNEQLGLKLEDRGFREKLANEFVRVKNNLVRFLVRCEKVLLGQDGLIEEYMGDDIAVRLQPIICNENDIFESNFLRKTGRNQKQLENFDYSFPEELNYDLDLFTIVVKNLVDNARLAANPGFDTTKVTSNELDNYDPIKISLNYDDADFPHFRLKIENKIADSETFIEQEVYSKIKAGETITTKDDGNPSNGTFLKVLRELLSMVNYSNLNREEDFMKARLFKYRDPELLGKEKFVSNNLIQVTSSDKESANFSPQHFAIEIIYPLGNTIQLTNT